MQKQNMVSFPLFLHILPVFLPSLYVFIHFCLVSVLILLIFLPFLRHYSAILSNVKTGRTV